MSDIVKLISRITAIQFVGGLVLAIFLMAMKSSQIRLEAKVESLQEKVKALTEQTNIKKG